MAHVSAFTPTKLGRKGNGMIKNRDLRCRGLIKDVLIGPDDTPSLAEQFHEKGFH